MNTSPIRAGNPDTGLLIRVYAGGGDYSTVHIHDGDQHYYIHPFDRMGKESDVGWFHIPSGLDGHLAVLIKDISGAAVQNLSLYLPYIENIMSAITGPAVVAFNKAVWDVYPTSRFFDDKA